MTFWPFECPHLLHPWSLGFFASAMTHLITAPSDSVKSTLSPTRPYVVVQAIR